jgi:hypothetical protein
MFMYVGVTSCRAAAVDAFSVLSMVHRGGGRSWQYVPNGAAQHYCLVSLTSQSWHYDTAHLEYQQQCFYEAHQTVCQQHAVCHVD